MKNIIIILGVILLAGVSGCGRQSAAEELRSEKRIIKKESSEAARAIATSKRKIQAELEELTQRLNAKVDEISADTTDKAERLRSELKLRKLQMNNALAELGATSKDQWAAMEQKTKKLISDVDNLLRNTSIQ